MIIYRLSDQRKHRETWLQAVLETVASPSVLHITSGKTSAISSAEVTFAGQKLMLGDDLALTDG